MKSAIFRSTALALLVAAGAAACTPVRQNHGFVSESETAPTIQVGVDTRTTVLQRLGTPSTIAPMDTNAWYYISSTQQRYAFYRPRTVERRVLVVRFGADDIVASSDTYGVDRGRIVAYNDDATPTRGRELGLLEQIFGNVGRTPPIRAGDNEEGPAAPATDCATRKTKKRPGRKAGAFDFPCCAVFSPSAPAPRAARAPRCS